MNNKILTSLEKWASWKSVLILFALQMLFSIVIMPAASGSDSHDLPVLDLQFFYTPHLLFKDTNLRVDDTSEFSPAGSKRKVTRRPNCLAPLAAQAGANARLSVSSSAYNVIPNSAPRKASGKS